MNAEHEAFCLCSVCVAERRAEANRKFTPIDLSMVHGREANGENAHRHRRNLRDPGSCVVPKGQTITLDEWRAQQGGSEA